MFNETQRCQLTTTTTYQLGFTGGAQSIFFPNPRITSIQYNYFWKQQPKKNTQNTPIDDGVSSLFRLNLNRIKVKSGMGNKK
jgi:2C-methyl-D-erythritol 2,4-cyclodiphosphate synthase